MNVATALAGRLLIGLAAVPAASRPLAASAADFAAQRNRMVDEEIVGAGIVAPRVIQSMRDTPRHLFMPLGVRANAYFDMAVSIGWGQTISPPFIVAYMTEAIDPQPDDKVLEIGTGSGYQAAVLSPLVREVYTIEIVEPLGLRAARTLKRLKYENVFTKIGDGYQGWAEYAPFDKIIVTCSPEEVPPKLVEQLREGGHMIVPVGERYQQSLYRFTKRAGQLERTALLPVLFVPMTGKAEDGRTVQPDPGNPQINNGGFELIDAASRGDAGTRAGQDADQTPPTAREGVAEKPAPAGWHYQRQLAWVEADDANQGTHYVTFNNTVPGRGAQALQGMAVDGRDVKLLRVSLWVKGKSIRPGENRQQQPVLAITFYDDNRAQTGYTWVGPWRDTFDWHRHDETVRVPIRAREAIVRIGMSGATGEISFDDVRIEKAK